MQQGILDLHFNAAFSSPVVLVLEPHEDTWEKLYKTAEQIVQSLPGRINNLYYMGNPKRYALAIPLDFKEHAAGWFQENKNRPALVGPIFERLEHEGFRGMVAVVTSRLPLDCEDWNDSELMGRAVFIRTADAALRPDGTLSEISALQGADQVLKLLENPPLEAAVESPGRESAHHAGEDSFVPLCWDIRQGGTAMAVCENSGFLLRIAPRGDTIDIHLRAYGSVLPVLQIKWARGNREVLQPVLEKPWCPDLQWHKIPEQLMPVVHAGIERGHYLCTQCGQQHRYDILLCPHGDLALKGMPLNACIIFTRDSYLTLAEWFAYPFEGKRIITGAGDLYERRSEGWRHLGKVSYYDEVSNGIWGLYHRI